jgi:type IV pilus assembly protein PilM
MDKRFQDFTHFFNNQLKRILKPSFLTTQRYSVGLDIGSAYVKAVSLERHDKILNITGFGCERIDVDLKNTIKKVLFNLPIRKKELAMSISSQSVVLRYVNMPLLNDEELAKSMTFELEKYIPFKKEEVNIDFAVLKKNQDTNKMSVLIAAAKKDLVESRISILRELGYATAVVDVCSLSVANYFEFVKGPQEGVCAIINLGAAITSVDIIEDGLLALSRDVFIGGSDFTKEISVILDKNIEEAEAIKLRVIDDNLVQSLESVFSNLVKEVKTSFDFYETQENRLIDKIFITGGTAQLKGLMEFFKHYLGQDVEFITFASDKFKLKSSLSFKVSPEEFEKKFNFLTIALGTAIRNLYR